MPAAKGSARTPLGPIILYGYIPLNEYYCQNPNSTISSIQLSLRLDYILTLWSTTHPPTQSQLVYSKLARADNCPSIIKRGSCIFIYPFIYLFIYPISITNLAKMTRALRAKRATRIRPRRGRNSSVYKIPLLLLVWHVYKNALSPTSLTCNRKSTFSD